VSSPLHTALTAARVAGGILRDQFLQPRVVQSKGYRDIVTDADFAAQAAILEILRRDFPDDAILSEEGRHDIDLDSDTPTWVIDPLDGTTNYARQLPAFSVSIGLARRGACLLGVIHDPLRGETFYAEHRRGAFAQYGAGGPQPLRVSAIADFGEALVGVDWSRDPQLREKILAAVTRAGMESRTLRAFGSTALGLAYIAAGRLDGYFHLALQPWDVAAGAVIIREAGGALSTPDGGAWRLGEPQLAASNRVLHEALIAHLGLG